MTVIRTCSLRLGLPLRNRGERGILGHDRLRRGQIVRPVPVATGVAGPRPSSNVAVFRRLLRFKLESPAVIQVSYCIRFLFYCNWTASGFKLRNLLQTAVRRISLMLASRNGMLRHTGGLLSPPPSRDRLDRYD